MPMSDDKLALVAQVLASAPPEAVQRLEAVLGTARMADPSLQPVHALAAEESLLRRTLGAVFAPLIPLTDSKPPRRALFSMRQLREAWGRVAAEDPGLAECAAFAAATPLRNGEEPPDEFDLACARAANLVSDPRLSRVLRFSRILRGLQPRLPGWVRNPTGANIAAIRLAFKDALDLDEDAGALFWEAVMGMLEEPWQVLRLISAATDRPSDRYLAASELSSIGERILRDIDERIDALKRFDPTGGVAAGGAAAASATVIVEEIAEFEHWIVMTREGPWGERIAEQKAAAARVMEARLREAELAIGSALPVQSKAATLNVRPAPKLATDPLPARRTRAEAYLALLEDSRSSAGAGGFASARNKTAEWVEQRIEQYCEDLLDLISRKESKEPVRVRAYFDLATDLYERLKGMNAAQTFRRRAASAS